VIVAGATWLQSTAELSVRPPAKSRRWRPASSPVRSATAASSHWLTLHALAHQPRVERVVVAVDAHVRVWRHPGDEPPVGVGPSPGQRPERRALPGEAVERPAAQRAVGAGVDVVAPAVELVLAVEFGGERPAGARSSSADSGRGSRSAPWPAVPGLEDQAAHRQLADQACIGLGGTAPARVERPLGSETSSSGSPPSRQIPRQIAHSRSGGCFENTSAPAIAREKPGVVRTTKPVGCENPIGHAAMRYTWISPPRRSRLRTRLSVSVSARWSGVRSFRGGVRPSARCGRWVS
jgi:hypothetical protein